MTTTTPDAVPLTDAERRRILVNWNNAQAWVGRQVIDLRSLERLAPGKRDTAIRHAFDRDDAGWLDASVPPVHGWPSRRR